jgi:putative ABC transport system permease protein
MAMDTVRQDLTYAVRILARRPGFTLAAAFTLAMGIAANATIFSLIDGVLLRPLPYPHSERMLSLWTSYPASHGEPDIFSAPNYLDLAARTKTLDAAAAYTQFSFTLAGGGQPEYIPGMRTTASMSRVLAVEPQLGRWFTREEDEGGQNVALLSDSLWRSRFGADRSVLGRTLTLNGQAYTVIGVLPPQIGFPTIQTHIYAPISFGPDDKASRGNVVLDVVARIRDGVSLKTAQAELRTIASALAQAYPAQDRGINMGAITLQESIVGNVRQLLLILWVAVAFMLAVGCANVANLLLTHAAGRQREFALRRSLGATNGRLARQLLTESVTLAILGGGLGLAMASWALPSIVAQLPDSFPRLRNIVIDAHVLWFTLAASLITGLLFGLAPAIGSTRRNLAQSLRDGERSGRGVSHRRLGRLLVIGEVAAVLVLLVGAGLVIRSLVRLSQVDPGFRTRCVVAWQLFLPNERYPDAAARRTFYRNVVDQVASLPGVQSAGLAQPLPFGPLDIVADAGFRIAGQPDPSPDQMPQGLITRASTTYFSAMGIPLLRGRVFTAQDTESSNSVVISDTLAKRYFAGRDALGQRLLLGHQRIDMQIVGIVGDVKHINLRNGIRPEFYLPMSRFTLGAAGLVVRTSGDAAALMPALQRRVWSLDNEFAGNLAAPVETLLHSSLAPARIAATLLAIFAAATLLLGLVGVYGVLAYAVRQRTREMGIRLALGASQGEVLRMVLREAMSLAGAGVAVGLLAALLLSRYIESLLFGVTSLDPMTYAIVAAAVPCAALLAAYVPARRATRVDPATSLRAE